MADPAIKVIPTPYQDVVALLHSESLRAVEQSIAAAIGSRIVEDYSTACTSYTQADMSVSGMTVTQTAALLTSHRDQLIRFGIAYLRDEAATDDAEEYPEGEQQEPSETVGVLGYCVGFGIKVAIYYNFLVNRTPAEFSAYLKNRRIPHQAKFARELRRVFDSVQQPLADSLELQNMKSTAFEFGIRLLDAAALENLNKLQLELGGLDGVVSVACAGTQPFFTLTISVTFPDATAAKKLHRTLMKKFQESKAMSITHCSTNLTEVFG